MHRRNQILSVRATFRTIHCSSDVTFVPLYRPGTECTDILLFQQTDKLEVCPINQSLKKCDLMTINACVLFRKCCQLFRLMQCSAFLEQARFSLMRNRDSAAVSGERQGSWIWMRGHAADKKSETATKQGWQRNRPENQPLEGFVLYKERTSKRAVTESVYVCSKYKVG